MRPPGRRPRGPAATELHSPLLRASRHPPSASSAPSASIAPSSITPSAPIPAAAPADARVDLYDVSGRLVRRLGQREISGEEAVFQWSGDDSGGRRVAAGIYLLRAQLGDQVQSLKVIW